MKLLYISCHDALEYDELSVFNKLGIELYSVGHYTDQDNPIATKRGKLPFRLIEDGFERFKRYHSYEKLQNNICGLECRGKNPYMIRLKKEFVDYFDVVLVNYYEENITLNWEALQAKQIILRTIAQYPEHVCEYRDRLKVVSLSDREYMLSALKPDAIIRQYVDTNYFNNWNPTTNYLLTVNKWLKKRGEVSAWDVYDKVSRNFNRVICGFGNEDIPGALSDLSQDSVQALRRKSRVYLSMCSKPAGITYSFIEALSTGIPVVSIGPRLGAARPDVRTFDIDLFLKNGENGFYSDDPNELVSIIAELMRNPNLAEQIGYAGRQTAIQNFSQERCIEDWRDFFKEHIR